MQKKPICICLLFAALLAALTACGAGKPAVLTAGDVTEQNLAQVCEVLSGAGLSNVDVFEQWVRSSLSGSSDEGSSGFSDADCRMTVMLLAGDRIAYDSVGSDYLFLEKIAFGDPLRITPVDDEQALLKVFSERPDYSVEDGAPAPVVCRNGERIGELTP